MNAAKLAPAVEPTQNSDVKLIAAVVHCRHCHFEWKSPLGAFSEVLHLDCPQCQARRPLNPVAE